MFSKIEKYIKVKLSKFFYKFIESDFGFDVIKIGLCEAGAGKSNLSNREKWLEKTLKKIPEGKKILDAGAGELKYKKFCGHLNYVSQDFGKYHGNNLDEGLQMESWDNSKLDVVSDIADMPIESVSFDSVMCVEVLEHLPKPTEAIKEFKRILKPGGKLIITSPFCSLTHFAPYYFSNGFSKYWFEEILSENGFKIIELEHNGNYFEYLAQEIRRMPKIEKKYTKKSILKKRINYFVIKTLLKEISELSNDDQKSHELLCFGLHILAEKR